MGHLVQRSDPDGQENSARVDTHRIRRDIDQPGLESPPDGRHGEGLSPPDLLELLTEGAQHAVQECLGLG
ncbi:Uncharacterised protein [Mycobacteroides abscessus subsp. abscessus]|nr:Uncharacterised protein [Mycobacteroides abscessus subsp. abscessus]